MSNTDGLSQIAAQIVLAQDGRSHLSTFSSSDRNLSMSEAYQVAQLVHENRLRLGWKPVGRKIGFTNKDMWALFGVTQPVWSFVYDKTYEDVGPSFDCLLSGLVQPKIEPEIVLCMRSAPRVGAGTAEVLDCVEWVAHGIEMVQCHYPGWKFTSTDAVCDSSFHGKLFVGERYSTQRSKKDFRALLKACEVSLYRGEELVEVGHGRNVLGSPLLALASLVDAVHREGAIHPIEPGEIITTGTITKAYSVHAGERWRTRFDRDDFAGLTVDFV